MMCVSCRMRAREYMRKKRSDKLQKNKPDDVSGL
jgi:hypothetical protein